MTKNMNTKKSLVASVLSMVVCLAMLIGATFAWFSDSVVSGDNQIVAGNLDIELYHKNANMNAQVDEEKVINTETDKTKLFVGKDGESFKWEPGAMVYENFTVKNVGTLALKYRLELTKDVNNTIKGSDKSLKDVLKVAYVKDNHINSDTRFNPADYEWESIKNDIVVEGTLGTNENDKNAKIAMLVYWEPTTEDNTYNLNNGKKSSNGLPLSIDLGVYLNATQNTVENDSFNSQYDKDALLQNNDGTYSKDDQLYVKDGDDYVAVEVSNIDDDVLVSANGQLYVKARTIVPVEASEDINGLLEASNDDKYVITEEAFKSEVVKGGNITTLIDVELTSQVNLMNDTTINGNGNTISGSPFEVTADVTFEDVELSKPTSTTNDATLVYARTGCESLTFEGVTFSDPQWEAIQITSPQLTSLTINNCVFSAKDVYGAAVKPGYPGAGVDNAVRFIHYEADNQTGARVDFTITNNVFKGCNKIYEEIAGLYFFDDGSTLTIGNNTFEDWDNIESEFADKMYVGYPQVDEFDDINKWTGNVQTYNID